MKRIDEPNKITSILIVGLLAICLIAIVIAGTYFCVYVIYSLTNIN